MTQLNLFSPPKTAGNAPAIIRPRDYQRQAIDNVARAFDDGNPGAILRLPTGCGKTLVGSWCAEEWLARGENYRVMVCAHERQLVRQFAAEIASVIGETPGIEMSNEYAGRNSRVVVASRQTLDRNNGERLARFDPAYNWLLMQDECHRWSWSLASCARIMEHFASNPTSRRLGLTATPERTDGNRLQDMFPAIALDYRLYDPCGGPCAVRDGWAVEYDQRLVTVEGVDWNNLREVAGDFDPDQLEAILGEREQVLGLVKPMLDIVGDRRTIIFNATVNLAKVVAWCIEEQRPESAQWLDGSTPDSERQYVYERHQRGDFQFLSVCGLCREGYNDPGISAVAVFRPTKSRPLAEQMKGRGCRPLRGLVDGLPNAEARRAAIASSDKPNCLIVDLVGITGFADAATTVEIFADGKPDEVIQRAKEIMVAEAGSKSVNVAGAVARAEQELADEQRERESRAAEAERLERERLERLARDNEARAQRSRLRGEVRYSQTTVGHNVYGTSADTPARTKGAYVLSFGKFRGTPITEVPSHYLRWGAENLSSGFLKGTFSNEIRRRAANKATA